MVKWISHRGESYDAPENTLAAFRLSQQRGTDGMECDVHLSADGFVVVSHDAATFRMGSKNLQIGSSTLEELRAIKVGG
ncbi:MAG: glycerophosphodiester phosphodiesterase, partial [Lentisphaeria bacterium]|nr:glycerophosphodiester phosphodiesterase [Lentisphaeria bacterium]